MAVAYREPLFETVGKRMVVTGPDYIKDHLPKVHQHTAYIGEKRPALEKTGDLRYLCRSASSRSLPAKYKHEYTGGIGWGIPEYNFINRSRMESGFQIKYGEISHCAIDKLTHRYQNPWQPKPFVLDKQGGYSRGFLAWNMSDYEDIHERNSKRAILIKQSKLLRTTLPARLPKLPRKEEKGLLRINKMGEHETRQRANMRIKEGVCKHTRSMVMSRSLCTKQSPILAFCRILQHSVLYHSPSMTEEKQLTSVQTPVLYTQCHLASCIGARYHRTCLGIPPARSPAHCSYHPIEAFCDRTELSSWEAPGPQGHFVLKMGGVQVLTSPSPPPPHPHGLTSGKAMIDIHVKESWAKLYY